VEQFLGRLAELPPALLYLVIGVGAALENVVPPIPADTFVVLGAFLAGSGRADPLVVFLVTWVANVTAALIVYGLAHRYGPAFFVSPLGKRLLQPHQLEQLHHFYRRWGMAAIFVSRFLPGLRAVVPVFAGLAHLPPARTAPPLVIASGIWYGVLVYAAAAAGANLDAILAVLARVGGALLWVAAPVLLALAYWWWRTRRRDP
jgi:membrane protein DedA with SNARE-associated domain